MSYTRYLSSKKTVDDRALNRHVLDRLRGEVAGRPLRVLEVGAGLGTMVARLVDWGVIARGEYVLLDVDPALLADARTWLCSWARQRGLSVTEGDALLVEGTGVTLSVRFVQAELGAFLTAPPSLAADLLVANAVLDLTEVPATLPPLFALAPGGLFWFTINFDGETIFQPEHPDDERFMRVYHRSMDERVRYGRPAGESRTGRHLFSHLRAAGATLLAAGASDWVVHVMGGAYEGDEAYFLGQIVDTIDEALRQYSEIDRDALAAWTALRRRQIQAGELVYVAHQLDFFGRCP
jgi:SAM-dependent methyltransferase